MATAPAVLLHPERHRLLEQLTDGLDASALTWLSGYAAGLAAGRSPAGAAAPAERSDPASRATVLYASQTGNGRRIAERLARNLESAGFAVRAVSSADYRVRELAQERSGGQHPWRRRSAGRRTGLQ
jgi:sulfite reductase (NADPH) flavoprotein alpha-component